MNTTSDELITVSEAAKMGNVTTQAVRGWIMRGRLNANKVSTGVGLRKLLMVKRIDVERLLDNNSLPENFL